VPGFSFAKRKARLSRASCEFGVDPRGAAEPQSGCGFLANGAPDFLGKFGGQFLHSMGGACMFGALLHDLLFTVPSSYEIAVHADVATSDNFGHVFVPPW
jgi:hypothetical protein